MKCPHCGGKAKSTSHYLKSKDPYVATVYYACGCGASFSIDKSLGSFRPPEDSEQAMRRVLADLAILPKEKLVVISKNVKELLGG